MNKKTGMIFAMGAAFFYGVSTITGKMAYVGGGNAVTISFYRQLLSIPILFLILKMAKISLKVTKRELIGLVLLGLLGGFITGALLYMSYEFISVGLSSCIHFAYPVILACIYAFIFKEKFSKTKVLALALGFGGMWFFLDSNVTINLIGILAALMSALTYAFYLIVMDKWGLKSMNGFKLSFYCCIFSGISLYTFGLFKGYNFTGVTSSGAWVWILGTSLLISVLGNTMIPVAVNNVGPTVTGIIGILEPVVSVIMGVLLLGESFGISNIVGAILVLGAGILLALEKGDIIKKVPV